MCTSNPILNPHALLGKKIAKKNPMLGAIHDPVGFLAGDQDVAPEQAEVIESDQGRTASRSAGSNKLRVAAKRESAVQTNASLRI